MTDQERMTAVKNGDLDQLGILFESYHKTLYHFFLSQTSSRQNSEDLVQDVFIKLLKYRQTYKAQAKFSTWLFSIAHNALKDYYKKNAKRKNQRELHEGLKSNDPDPGDLMVKEDEAETIRKALNQLSDEYRETLILSRFQNMKYEQIAQVMNCKVGTVKARVHWALKELNKEYLKLSRIPQ